MGLDTRFFKGDDQPARELHTVLAKGQALVTDRFIHASGSRRLIILVPAWHNGEPVYGTFAQRLARSKIPTDVCTFYLADPIFSADVELTRTYLLRAGRETAERVHKLQANGAYDKTVVIGSSLGCTVTMLAIKNDLAFDKLVLITPGDDFAQTAWEGIRTQHLRRAYAEQGFTLKSLKETWQDVAPTHNVSKTEDKVVEVYLSKADNVIPYKRGLAFVEALKQAGANVTLHTNRTLGHYATIGRYYYFGKP